MFWPRIAAWVELAGGGAFYFGGQWTRRGFYRLGETGGAWQLTPAHAETHAGSSDLGALLAEDLDGDGRRELHAGQRVDPEHDAIEAAAGSLPEDRRVRLPLARAGPRVAGQAGDQIAAAVAVEVAVQQALGDRERRQLDRLLRGALAEPGQGASTRAAVRARLSVVAPLLERSVTVSLAAPLAPAWQLNPLALRHDPRAGSLHLATDGGGEELASLPVV